LLSKEGISHFVDKMRFANLTSDIWEKICCCLKRDCDEDLRLRRLINPMKSEIVEFKSTILSIFPTVVNKFARKRFRLLYRGSQDGFQSSNFHSKCDNVPNTLTIIQTTQNFSFGGFTSLPWDSGNQYKADTTGTTFVFSVTNRHHIVGKTFPLTSSNYALYCSSSYGPIFGGYSHHCIYGANGCNGNTSNDTYLGDASANDTGLAGNQVFTGERNFTVKEIEVFALNDEIISY
jgi:hypothetical protein